MRSLIIFLLILTTKSAAYAIVLEKKPFLVVPLPKVQDGRLLYIGDRMRSATCSGASWFDANCIVSVHLTGAYICSFQIDPRDATYMPIQMQAGAGLNAPENIVFSPDRRLLAISNCVSGTIVFYKMDPPSPMMPSEPLHVHHDPEGTMLHGMRFSPDGRYFIYTCANPAKMIRVFRVELQEEMVFEPVQTLYGMSDNLRPKGVDFSPDGRFIAVCYAARASFTPTEHSGAIATFKFDIQTGQINPNPLSKIEDFDLIAMPDDLCFDKEVPVLFLSNQGADSVSLFEFNPETGTLGNGRRVLESPLSQLSFPHGISLSPDGKYLSVCNYGDNTLKLFSIDREKVN